MMNILVVGEYYSNNLGDPLLCETVTKILQEAYPEATLIPYDLSGKTSMTESFVEKNKSSKTVRRAQKILKHFHFYKNHLKKQKTKKQYQYRYLLVPLKQILSDKKIDIVVFAGGEMFMDYFAERIFVVTKRLRKVNTIFHACGMYYLSEESKELFRRIIYMKNIKSVSVRDSYNRFIEFFGKEKIKETYDTALLCSNFFQPSKEKTFELGFGVIDRPEYYDFQLCFLKQLVTSGLTWQVFTNGSVSDYDTAIKLLQDAGIKDENIKRSYLHKKPCSAEELVKEVTCYKSIIAFRMHCQIVAVSFGISSFGFVWDDKVKEFYDKLGSKNFMYPTMEIKLEDILKKLFTIDSSIYETAINQGKESKESLLYAIESVINS